VFDYFSTYVGVFFIIKANGNLEVWDLMDRYLTSVVYAVHTVLLKCYVALAHERSLQVI